LIQDHLLITCLLIIQPCVNCLRIQVFNPENFGNGSDNKFAFNDLSGPQYRYLANTILNAVFLQFDNEFSEKLRATWGLRVEGYDQLIGSTKSSDIRYFNTVVRDFCPV
jgi:hypothetical protein